MLDGREDQAAGLRRLFRRAPPQVVALYAGGRRAADNAALAAHRIAGRSERYYGSVSRTVELPVEVAPDKVSARAGGGRALSRLSGIC